MTPIENGAPAPARDRGRHRGAAVLGLVLLIVGAVLARSIDVVKTGYGLKGDEATYVAMALSAAYDHDLSFERGDLVRFWGIYRTGPEGIFLKRGRTLSVRSRGHFPWLRIGGQLDPNPDRLYFGKAFVYPLVAAPFVRLLGLNGLLLLHVLLLAAVGACGYLFLAAKSPPIAAAAFTSAFIGAAAVPVYGVFLTPEIFNFSIVFVALFLWLYDPDEPGPDRPPAWRQAAAAVLLGFATYSKPSNALLIGPLVLAAWWQRRWTRGVVLGAVFVATVVAWFGFTAVVSGEFNYQGGDRKTFYGTFPFDSPTATWDRRGISVRTDGSAAAAGARAGQRLGSVLAQRRVLSLRPPLRLRAVLLPGRRRDRLVVRVADAPRSVAPAPVPDRGRLGAGAHPAAPVHVERRRRPARQSLFPEHLSRALLSHAAARVGGAGARSPGWAARCSPRRCSSIRSWPRSSRTRRPSGAPRGTSRSS